MEEICSKLNRLTLLSLSWKSDQENIKGTYLILKDGYL
jgi:hypothetical protein